MSLLVFIEETSWKKICPTLFPALFCRRYLLQHGLAKRSSHISSPKGVDASGDALPKNLVYKSALDDTQLWLGLVERSGDQLFSLLLVSRQLNTFAWHW